MELRLLWRDAETGRVIRVLQERYGSCVGSEQQIFAGGLNPFSVLVDAVTGQAAAATAGTHPRGLTAAFSANGRWLMTGGKDGISRLWSVPDAKLLEQRSLHGNVPTWHSHPTAASRPGQRGFDSSRGSARRVDSRNSACQSRGLPRS